MARGRGYTTGIGARNTARIAMRGVRSARDRLDRALALGEGEIVRQYINCNYLPDVNWVWLINSRILI